jgi:hypothetical protein
MLRSTSARESTERKLLSLIWNSTAIVIPIALSGIGIVAHPMVIVRPSMPLMGRFFVASIPDATSYSSKNRKTTVVLNLERADTTEVAKTLCHGTESGNTGGAQVYTAT